MSGLMYGNANSGGSGAGDKPQFEYDAAAESSFVAAFHALPPKTKTTIRLFDRSSFYSAHGEDAFVVASAVYKTQSTIKYLGGGSRATGLPSVTLNSMAGKNFLKEALTSKQLRIEIWSNEAGGKKSNKWEISAQASPGNLQQVEELLFSNEDMVTAAMVIAFKIRSQDGVIHVGAAFADATNRTLGVVEYAENELFSNTESLLIQLGARECILPDDKTEKDAELKNLRLVIDRCDCIVTPRKRSDFAPKDIEADLERILESTPTSVSTMPELDMKLAMGSANALIAYLGLLTDSSNFGIYSMTKHNLEQYLRLDNSALRALSLFPEQGAVGHSKNMSVFGLLNKCRTAQGTRLLAQWLKQPLRTLPAIQERHDLTEIFLNDIALRTTLQDQQLKMMPDLHRISKRFQRRVASLEDVVRVYQAIIRLPGMIDELKECKSTTEEQQTLLQTRFVEPLQEKNGKLAKMQEMVVATIDLDELSRHRFVIKADFDARLQKIKTNLTAVSANLDKQHKKAGKDLDMDIDKKLHMENHHVYGYVFRITRNDAKALKNAKGYDEVTTQKNGVYFRTRALKDLSDEYQDLLQSYESHQSSVVKDIIATAATYCSALEQLNVILAELDVLLSFAYVSGAAPTPYVKPIMQDEQGELRIEEGRHPCLEVQEDISFIPNDTVMVPGESEFLIITGPNMGGKSTYIRQTGIIALMAQIGCFVPAAEGCTLPVLDCILARVGAGDSQLKGVSTFMAEMLETATILKTASPKSLVIIDELGRGTSTYDGFGLAWAISEHIAKTIGCKCLFATHFHELTSLAKQQPHVQNLHVVAFVKEREGGDRQDRDVVLLFKVAPGISDQSFGVHVAELAHFPESVIKLAKRKVEELEDFGDDDDDESPKLPVEATEEGTALVDEFLLEWRKRRDAAAKPSAGDKSGTKRRKLDPQTEVAELRNLVEEYRGRMEANPWVSKVLQTF